MKNNNNRLYATLAVTLGIWALLAWEHFTTGVASHHLLHNPDLPAISNAWGGVVLPALTWFLLGRAEGRPNALYGLAGGVVFGGLIAVFFTLGFEPGMNALVMSLPVLALLVPIYRAECVLGFVLAMTLVFGAVLPTLFATVVAAGAAVLYHLVRRPVVHLAGRLRRPKAPA